VHEGWFVVNVRDAEWWFAETRGSRCAFESEYGDSPVEFAQLGINLTILKPGQHNLYHAESNQEAFLVLSGECILLVEGEERRLRSWDFFHCPPWTEHGVASAGDGPCVILMVGARSGTEWRYPASELAARYGASVAAETDDWRQARRSLEPDELQVGEESVYGLRPGTCRAVNGLADSLYIGEATVTSRATGGVFAGSH
jgi:quercetin dioxygenase-like cupin family protein